MVDEANVQESVDELLEQGVRKSVTERLNVGNSGGVHKSVREVVEREMLNTVMIHCRGNQSQAAELLGINRGTLRTRLAQYGLMHVSTV